MLPVDASSLTQFSQVILYLGACFIATGALSFAGLKGIQLKLFAYTVLLIIVGFLGVFSPASLLFKVFSGFAIVVGIIIIISRFFEPLLPVATFLLLISPFFFPMITGGLIAVGSWTWLLSLILSLIALFILKSIAQDLLGGVERIRSIIFGA